MALALEIANLDGLDDAVKGLYVENDGAFKLDVSGMPDIPDVAGLKTALQSERELAKKARGDATALMDKYSGVDLDKYNQVMTDLDKAAEDKLIAENKSEEVWANRTEKLNKEWQSKVDAEAAKVATEQGIIKQLKLSALQGELSMQLMNVPNMHEFGKRDALLAAENMFSLDDHGRSVLLEDDGTGNMVVAIGKDGKTPYSLEEMANSNEFREKNPHWFSATGGGGGLVQGKTNNFGGARTIARSKFEGLNPVEQSKSVRDGIKVVDG